MIVKEIKSISSDGQVADLVVSDGIYECFAFSCPFRLSEGQTIQEPLSACGTENLMLTDEEEYSIKQTNEYFQHDCIAQVVNKAEDLVRVGGLFITLDERLPAGCDDGAFVQFSCSRLDVLW